MIKVFAVMYTQKPVNVGQYDNFRWKGELELSPKAQPPQ